MGDFGVGGKQWIRNTKYISYHHWRYRLGIKRKFCIGVLRGILDIFNRKICICQKNTVPLQREN